jgi:hypothetical protein
LAFRRATRATSKSHWSHVSAADSRCIGCVAFGDQQVAPLAIMHLWSESALFGPESYLLRPIMQCWLGDSADVALGVAATATNKQTGAKLTHWSWPLSWAIPPVGAPAATYAFPNHSVEQTLTGQLFRFSPDLYPGEILEIGDFRDPLLAPYTTYTLSLTSTQRLAVALSVRMAWGFWRQLPIHGSRWSWRRRSDSVSSRFLY